MSFECEFCGFKNNDVQMAMDLQDIRKMDWILIIFALLSIYVIALKILADLNCTFWSISTSQIISQALQFGAEGFFLRLFYGWLENKTSVLKENLE